MIDIDGFRQNKDRGPQEGEAEAEFPEKESAADGAREDPQGERLMMAHARPAAHRTDQDGQNDEDRKFDERRAHAKTPRYPA